MLDWAAWTLTHSSGGPAELAVALGLAVALELVPPLGVVEIRESRDAFVVAEAEDADAEPVPVAEDAEPVPVDEPVCEGDADVGLSLSVALADAVVEDPLAEEDALPEEDPLAEEDPLSEGVMIGEGVGEGVGSGVGVGDDRGEGDGDGGVTAGSAWHTTFAVAAACPCGVSGAACALPSAPRVRKLPLSTVTATTRTCPKRIRIACPR
jgi:hypothetical protein